MRSSINIPTGAQWTVCRCFTQAGQLIAERRSRVNHVLSPHILAHTLWCGEHSICDLAAIFEDFGCRFRTWLGQTLYGTESDVVCAAVVSNC